MEEAQVAARKQESEKSTTEFVGGRTSLSEKSTTEFVGGRINREPTLHNMVADTAGRAAVALMTTTPKAPAMCAFFKSMGRCPYGNSCTFSHTPDTNNDTNSETEQVSSVGYSPFCYMGKEGTNQESVAFDVKPKSKPFDRHLFADPALLAVPVPVGKGDVGSHSAY